MWAGMNDHTPIVQYLLENGADVDAFDYASMSNLSLWTIVLTPVVDREDFSA